jgi:Mrp family chromosome partitioning ATPase
MAPTMTGKPDSARPRASAVGELESTALAPRERDELRYTSQPARNSVVRRSPRIREDAVALAVRLAERLRGEGGFVVFTGLERGAGASTVTTEVATAMALSHREPVLLVDANLRDPILAARLGSHQYPGLCELIRGEATLDSAIQEIVPGSLFFLPAGIPQGEPAALLSTTNCSDIFRALTLHFGWVLADCAPVGDFVDGVVIGARSRFVVLVLQTLRHRRSELVEVRRMLSLSGISRVGVCITESPDAEGA